MTLPCHQWRPHEPSLETTAKNIVTRAVAAARRPMRMADGTLEVFDVDAKEQLEVLRKLREALGAQLPTVVFHTREESLRLYADVIDNFPHHCHYTVEVNFDGKRKFFCDLCGRAF